MTVNALIGLLSRMDGDLEVHFEYTASDHWRTRLAPKADGAYVAAVTHSEYHRTDKLLRQDGDEGERIDPDEKQASRMVCVIY